MELGQLSISLRSFKAEKVAKIATGEMFNCCTIGSRCPCLRSRRAIL